MKNLNPVFNLLLFLFFNLLVISPLSAGGDTCESSEIVGTGPTEGNLVAADSKNDDYFKFITGGPGEVIIRFESTEAINFYAGTTGCPISNYFLDVSSDSGTGLVTLDANTTIYIHAERRNKNANFNFTIEFTEAPTALDLPPTICYDYAYEQDNIYFTETNDGSLEPSIEGTELDPSKPITVEFYIQNTDAADNDMENMVVNIFDINTTQASYELGTTYIIKPGDLTSTHYTDINATTSYNNNIIIGDVESRDFFYVYYDLDPVSTVIDIPLNIRLDYDVSYDYGTSSSVDIHYKTIIDNTISLCNNNSSSYTPAYGIFNMEDSVLTHIDKYNLPTQTANRVGDFVVAAYNPSDVYSRIEVNTPVAIELIDAGKYDNTATSCRELDSVVGSRIWVIFDDNATRTDFNYTTISTAVNDPLLDDILPLSTAEEFYSLALENAAFKLSYNGAGNGELIELDKVPCAANNSDQWCYNVLNFTEIIKYNGGNCIQDVDGREGNIDKIPQFCNNAGKANASAMTPAELAICMECIYGFDVNYLCSRDNFAIRPESYRMTLNDQKQTDTTQQSPIAINDDIDHPLGTSNNDRNHTNNTPYHVAAGYNYRLQIRATNHQDDNATLGYDAGFVIDGNDSQRFFSLVWQPFTDDETYCNDIEDHNKTLSVINGGADLNLSSTQVGKYNLTIFDKLWTRVDWDPDAMPHHTTGQGVGYFLRGTDCVEGTSYVPSETSLQTGINGDDLANVSGCNITSNNHIVQSNIAERNGIKYKDIALRVHPYKFDHSALIPFSGPNTTRDQTFIYINTPDINDSNMSYNMNGTFKAVGYDDGHLSNFVDQCYAEDVNMTLYLQYLPTHQTTDSEPYLSYDLVDTNSTGGIINPRPIVGLGEPTYRFATPSTGPLMIEQNSTNFVKDMNGSVNMDLGYNFKRNNNEVMNPRMIEMNDFNITYRNNPADIRADLKSDFEIYGNKDLNDSNVSFYYGRTKASKFFYEDITDDNVSTPITILVYCNPTTVANTCSFYGINTSGLDEIDELNWYLSSKHRASSEDGNVTLKVGTLLEGTGSPSINPANITIESNGIDNNVIVTSGAATLPMTVPIELVVTGDPSTPPYTAKWLIYNEADEILMPSPFYKVRFIGEASWTGEGQTGHVMDTEASYKKSQRVDW